MEAVTLTGTRNVPQPFDVGNGKIKGKGPHVRGEDYTAVSSVTCVCIAEVTREFKKKSFGTSS